MLIAYATPSAVPSNTAMSRRMEGITLALREAGHEVLVISGAAAQTDSAWRSGPVHRMPENSTRRGILGHAANFAELGRATVAGLRRLAGDIDLVLTYGGLTPFTVRVLRWARSAAVRVMADVVEWPQPGHQPTGPIGPHAANAEFAMRAVLPRLDGLVCISSYLGRYYRSRGVPVAVVPPMLDTRRERPRLDPSPGYGRTLSYGGNPGHKDDLDAVVGAIVDIDPSGASVRLTICGPSREQVRDLPALRGRTGPIPPAIIPLGRVDQRQATRSVREADFLPLFRDDRRFARAGFPTKLVEGMAMGTPMVGTDVGDIPRYLTDGRDSLLARGTSRPEARRQIRRALELEPAELGAMRAAAWHTARTRFDFRGYAGVLDDLVSGRLRP